MKVRLAAVLFLFSVPALAEREMPVQAELSIVGPVCSEEESKQDPDCDNTKAELRRLFDKAWEAHWKKEGPGLCDVFNRAYKGTLLLDTVYIQAGDDVPPTKKNKKVRRNYVGLFNGDVRCSESEKP